MTVAPVSTETAYLLTGTTTGPFATVWPYAQAADVQVWLHADGADRQLASPGDFSLATTGPLLGGGDVTLLAGPTGATWNSGDKVTLVRVSADGQAAALGEVTGFSPKSVEDALDALAREIQDLRSQIATRGLVREPGASDFDAGGHAITGLAISSDTTAAATVGQLATVAGGGPLEIATAWADISGKPATFPASPMGVANITDFETGLGAKLEAGANIAITHVGGKYRFAGPTPPAAPVTSVNGETGDVIFSARLVMGFPSLKDYGAACDGVTDDTTHVNAAIADINAGNIKGFLVPGKTVVSGALTTITSQAAIKGFGIGSCAFVHKAGSGNVTMLSVNLSTNTHRFSMSDLSLLSDQVNSGQALYLRQNTHNLFHSMNLMNIDVTGTATNNKGWNRGIETVNVANCTFHNVNHYGYVNTGLSYPSSVMQAAWAWNSRAEVGLASVNNRWINCDVTWVQKAWKGSGHLEGFSWVTCCPAFVGQPWEMLISDAGMTPYWAWINCQAEYFNEGLKADTVAYVSVQGCQFYQDDSAASARVAVDISNAVEVDVNHNFILTIVSANLGTSSGVVFTNVDKGRSTQNIINGVYGTGAVGVHFTGTSTNCRSKADTVNGIAADAFVYINDAGSGANLLSNQRREMQIYGATDAQGKASNAVAVGSGTATTTQTPIVQVPFGVMPGDRLHVSLASFLSRSSSDTSIQAIVREYNHRGGTGSPFQILQKSPTQKNWNRMEEVNTNKLQAYFYDDIEFDVIAEASDALISFDFLNASASCAYTYAEMTVTRL